MRNRANVVNGLVSTGTGNVRQLPLNYRNIRQTGIAERDRETRRTLGEVASNRGGGVPET